MGGQSGRSSDVQVMLGRYPGPARARSNPAPAAARPAAVRPVHRPGSCHSPDWPGQRVPTAPHGSWAPRASRFLPAPWQAAQVAEPRSSGPAPAARSSSRRCPLGTDQQQDGGQPRGRGPGVIVTRAAKNPPPAETFPNQQPRCPTPWGCFPLTGRLTCHSEPTSHRPCRTLRHVTVTARVGACVQFRELLAAEVLWVISRP